jgi:hypothetical protein
MKIIPILSGIIDLKNPLIGNITLPINGRPTT